MNSIKTKLIILIVGALLFVSFTFGLVSYLQARSILLSQTEQNFLRITEEISNVVRANMKVNIAIMETIASRRIIDDNTPWAEKAAELRKDAERAGFQEYAVADKTGNVTFFNSKQSGVNIADREYFKRAISGTSTYSEVVISKETGLPVVTVAVPIKRNGSVTGVLFGIRDGNEISKLVQNIKIGETGYSYIIDKSGTIQGHKNSKLVVEKFNPIKAADENKNYKELAGFLKIALANGGGTGSYEFDKKDVYASLSRINDTDGWCVGLAMETDEILSGVNYLRTIIIIIAAVMSLLGGAMAYFIGNSIASPVIEAVNFAEVMSELDLTKKMPDEFLSRKDEIGILARSLLSLNNTLRETVIGIIKASQQVAIATEQIGQDNQNLSQRTSEQASSLEEIAATIEEATASTKLNSDNASEARRLSDNTLGLAENGGAIVGEAVKSIGEINESSTKIAEITSMINEIAFQTNLLALNAAVEAARAGEQGRGFAVVAGEVRNLAQRSGEAAKQIGALIKDSVEKIENGTAMVNNSGTSLREIIGAVKQVNMLVSEMSAASDEQRRGIEQINTAIMEMDNLTQQNAALVEETASASEEMSSQAQELLAMVKSFNVGDDAIRIEDYNSFKIHKHDEHISFSKKRNEDNYKRKSSTNMSSGAAKVELLSDEGYEKF